MSKNRLILIVTLYVLVIVLSANAFLGLRHNFIENHAKLSEVSTEGYEKYYDKWKEKRLEGAKIFIRMGYEPHLALAIIDPLIGLCIFLLVINFVCILYYERRHAKLLNKYNQP